MIVALVKVNVARGFFWSKGGVEIPLILGVIGLVLVLTGSGRVSVDHAVGVERRAI